MDQDQLLSLGLWREVSRQRDIAEALLRLGPLVRGHIPADAVVVRWLDLAHNRLEAVAQDGNGRLPAPTRRIALAEKDLEELLTWMQQGRAGGNAADVSDPSLAHLLAAGFEGALICVPLTEGGRPLGVLELRAAAARAFTAAHVATATELLEPFSVALRQDRELAKLNALREAAEADKRALLRHVGRDDPPELIIGIQSGLKRVMESVGLVAGSDLPVLIYGETGSGKELVARAIHERSRRAAGPFLRVNCGAIPPELIDSELFGHEKGSFTGAADQRKGWFERADRGTLLLDEVGELAPPAQVRLLRVLQDGSFQRVGGQKTVQADVRIVAATHRDLRSMVPDGRFRADLWYRIAVFPVDLPPLRDRPQDVPALAQHFAERAAVRFGLPSPRLSWEDTRALLSYAWPGNVRELASVMDRAVLLGKGVRVDVAGALGTPLAMDAGRPLAGASAGAASGAGTGVDSGAGAKAGSSIGDGIAAAAGTGSGSGPGRGAPRSLPPPAIAAPSFFAVEPITTLQEVVRSHIERALLQTHGRIEGPFGAARLLGVNPATLRARMRKLKIDRRAFRRPAEPGAAR